MCIATKKMLEIIINEESGFEILIFGLLSVIDGTRMFMTRGVVQDLKFFAFMEEEEEEEEEEVGQLQQCRKQKEILEPQS